MNLPLADPERYYRLSSPHPRPLLRHMGLSSLGVDCSDWHMEASMKEEILKKGRGLGMTLSNCRWRRADSSTVGAFVAEVGCHVWHSLHVFILNSVERESEIEVISSTSHE